MFKRCLTGTMVLCLIIVFVMTGCPRGQTRKPVPGTPAGEEPTISLFINETGEKKNIKMEEYIAGVVAAEMDPAWPLNALAAQAILARTFTMENIEAGRVKRLRGTDASTSVEEFQAYDASRINDNVRQAVQRTRGEVVTHNGNYIKAWFSACDGGVSATAAEGLAYTKTPTPYIKGEVKDGCLDVTVPENKRWESRIPLQTVRAAVQKITGRDPGPVTTVRIAQRGPSGRAERIGINGATVGGPALRLALGSEKVRSMLLSDISIQGGNLVMTGRGFGHGVGMCQWGANKLSREGKSPEEIVRFFFKDIEIKKLWD